MPAGTYSLTAKAYDSAGSSATSAAVTVTVSGTNRPPTVSLTSTIATAPRLVVFVVSADHATNVTSYFFEVFAAGANPATAVAIASSDLGKPPPDANNDITVDRSALFNALSVGNYVATMTAVGRAVGLGGADQFRTVASTIGPGGPQSSTPPSVVEPRPPVVRAGSAECEGHELASLVSKKHIPTRSRAA